MFQLEEEMKEAFRYFDKSGDGFVSITELRHALMKLGDTMADDELEEMMALADKNEDGQLSYDEFVKWFSGERLTFFE